MRISDWSSDVCSSDLVMALNNLAAVLEEQTDPAAYSYAQRAYALQPTNPVVMDTYGWGLLQQGKVQEAAPLLKQAAQAVPRSEERRVGKECVSPGRSRWSPYT